MSGLKRTIEIKMRLTEGERDTLLERMRDAGISNREAYLRNMALTGYILRLDMSEVREALRLMANVASNVNQLSKRANETRSIYANDIIQLREEVGNLRLHVTDIMKVFSKIRKIVDLQ